MKRLLINIVLLLSWCKCVEAQTRPQQSMYMFNYMSLNPAATGIEDYGQLRTGARQQWMGVKGAPSTAWLAGDMRLGEGKTTTDPDAPGITKGHGAGFNLYYDKIGPYSTVNMNIGYAYHLPLSSSLALSAGFSGGIQRTRFDMSGSTYPDQSWDPATLPQGATSKKYLPDLNVGLLLNGSRFFAGLSLMQLAGADFVDARKSQSKLKPQFISSLGYMFPLDESGSGLWLSGLIKSDFANPVRYDINAKVRYQDLLWLIATYRPEDAFGLGFGLNITRRFVLGYQYEWGTSNQISTFAKGSHELWIGFKFLKDKQRSRPKMGW